jgi:hypothetical protein
VTAYGTSVWAGGATSPPYVELRVEDLLPGCFTFAVALVKALSAMLAWSKSGGQPYAVVAAA